MPDCGVFKLAGKTLKISRVTVILLCGCSVDG
jgi:hypothetical protein